MCTARPCLRALQVKTYLWQRVASAAAEGSSAAAAYMLLKITEVPAVELQRHVEELERGSKLDPDVVSGRGFGPRPVMDLHMQCVDGPSGGTPRQGDKSGTGRQRPSLPADARASNAAMCRPGC